VGSINHTAVLDPPRPVNLTVLLRSSPNIISCTVLARNLVCRLGVSIDCFLVPSMIIARSDTKRVSILDTE
jgi:hypothetical protein